jgi:ZipA, C-terminal FtsZ-binding domain
VRPDKAVLSADKVRALVEAAGCRLYPDGRFRMLTATGDEAFTVANLEPTPFSAANIVGMSTHGVTVMFDVPRASAEDGSFRGFAQFAHQLAADLDAQLVDDNRQPISPQALTAIGQAVARARIGLEEAQIPAASSLALRVFAP